MKLLVATKNPGKLAELAALCGGMALELLTLSDCPGAPDVEEDGATFAENAEKKALAYADWSGLPTMADDSGLCVEALGGRPGVLSARFAGGDRTSAALCAKLLAELAGVPDARRGAAFHCAIALARPGRVLFTVEGVCPGRIIDRMRGTNGFGYDPVFLYEPLGLTFAQLDAATKNRVSHRARALEAFRERLARIQADGRFA